MEECVGIPREPVRIKDFLSGRINEKVEGWLGEMEKKEGEA